jgi:hypothetical protein
VKSSESEVCKNSESGRLVFSAPRLWFAGVSVVLRRISLAKGGSFAWPVLGGGGTFVFELVGCVGCWR